MMRRYMRLPVASAIRSDHDYTFTDAQEYLARTVHEPEPRMVNTGLLYPDGSPIIAYEAMGPIGFVRFEEE